MASATGSLLAFAAFERLPTDVLHDDVADGLPVPVGVLDEVEDLHDRRVHHLGEESPLGHRDRLRLGVAGMHQALEHHRTIVDVAVQRQVHPAQPTVRDAAPDLVLAGDDVTRNQLRQKRIRASAVGAPALGPCVFGRGRAVCAGSADRSPAVPAEPFGLRHNRIGHQCFERVDVGHPRDLDQAAAQPPDRRTRAADFVRSCGSVSTMCTGVASESSSKSGRKTACVATGRPCEDESTIASAGWVPGDVSVLRRLAGRRRRLGVPDPPVARPSVHIPRARRRPAPGRAPSTTCGTTCSRCRRGGCAPGCR